MDHETQYSFNDFTIKHYVEILSTLKKRFEFTNYNFLQPNGNHVYMRHDVDFSPQRALRMAEIERNEGVTSTFFWHMHSEFYNLFDKDTFEIVKKIQSYGHDFGIHFDTHFYKIQTENEIEIALNKEKKIINLFFGITPTVFSFHNTNEFIMGCQKDTYSDLINTYSEYFQKKVKYCSDSNGYWRYDRMMDVVNDNNFTKIQLLTHPENWTEETMSPYNRILRAINGRAVSNINFYNQLLTMAGRKIIK